MTARWSGSPTWRQGAVVPTSVASELVDHAEGAWLIVLSHDCDLAASEDVEPYVELIIDSPISVANPGQTLRKHPRKLDIKAEDGEATQFLTINIHDRLTCPKSSMTVLQPSSRRRLRSEEVDLLTKWVSQRLIRPAFPDEFWRRIDGAKTRLSRLFKKQICNYVTGIFLGMSSEELAADKDYRLLVWITARSQNINGPDTYRDLAKVAETLRSLLEKCPGISIAELEVRGENAVTIEDLRVMKRWDLDARSLAQDPPGDLHEAAD